ncbi:MAG: hypothetical protein HOV80_26745, partial [Polyangiaceae bacterium]|nr:hypothetical protein [Polyangiaceae bacterium]
MPTTRSLRSLAFLLFAPLMTACIGDIGDGPDDGSDLGEDEGFICGEGPHPSRTDARRLTPIEYKNALRDVFGTLVMPSEDY